jgi:hypothetical protein
MTCVTAEERATTLARLFSTGAGAATTVLLIKRRAQLLTIGGLPEEER